MKFNMQHHNLDQHCLQSCWGPSLLQPDTSFIRLLLEMNLSIPSGHYPGCSKGCNNMSNPI
eukprot:4993958-Amphidinium_carterae.1